MSTTLQWTDGDFTVATPVSGVVLQQPFDGDSGEYLLTQNFWQFRANFTPLALNTAYPNIPYTSYLLVSEGALQDIGGGIVQWTRTYAQVPATRDDWSSLAYNFIGYYGTVANLAIASAFPVVGRNRQTFTVPCRIQNDYYLIPTTYATPVLIPIVLATKYYIPQGTVSGGFFVPTYSPGSANDIATGSDTDTIYDPAAFGGVIPTLPSRTTYQGWITAGTEIVAESSVISRWHGNIYQRQTKYVKAR